MSRLMKPHADLVATLRRLLAEAPPPSPSPPRPVLSRSACKPQPAQTKHRARKSKGFWACDVCNRTVHEVTLGLSPEDGSRARCVECSRARPTDDPRGLSNTKAHHEAPHTGPLPKTAGAAAKLRRRAMETCMCRTCALALNPPTTFAEWHAFGLGSIRAEHDAVVPRGPAFECELGDDCCNPRHNGKATSAFKAAEDAGKRGW